MSGCCCSDSQDYRVTGEVLDTPAGPDSNAVGTGPKQARVRCAHCGGKAGWVGSDLLTLLGLSLKDVRNGRCLTEDERVRLEVDLI